MRVTLTLFAALALAVGAASTADAQKLDKAGRCHDAKGHYAKASVCGGAAPATKASAPKAAPAKAAAAPAAPAVAPAPVAAAPKRGQRCKNANGKFAKCGSPGATPA